MQTYATITVGTFIEHLASPSPTPGGGAVAALAGALGASLLLMVAGMSRTRSGTPTDAAELTAAAERLKPLQQELQALADADTAAYLCILEASRLPKSSEVESTIRSQAMQAALHQATDVPLQALRACERALQDAAAVVRAGNPNATADALVGMEMLVAAARGAAVTLAANLPAITDRAYAEHVSRERDELTASIEALVSGHRQKNHERHER